MTAWSDGYVVDVSYTEGVYRELSPAWLSMVSVLNGHPPLDVSRPFNFVELGCGNGLTSLVIAATCPQALVWGCDFNPAHIERARSIAERAGLTNCSFDEASFEELAGDRDLGPSAVDVVVMHGVYTWVTPQNRQHIVDVIRERLVPGGLVHVSYNVTTGWSSLLPLREAMRLQVSTDSRRSDLAVRSAVATLEQVAEDGARSFPLGPHEQQTFEKLSSSDPVYVAHEYLGGSFNLLMFADVAEEMSAAKCVFIGSSNPANIALDLRVPGPLLSVAEAAPDVLLRETICDLATNVPFRRDVYRRGTPPQTPIDRRQWIDELTLVGLGRAFEDGATVGTPAGPLRLDEARYRPLIERLEEGPLTLAELRTLPYFAGRDQTDAVLAAAVLVTGQYAAPGLGSSGGDEGTVATAALNRVLIEAARQGRPMGFLAASAIGSVDTVDWLTTLAFGELSEADPSGDPDPVVRVLERVRTSNRPLVRDGITVTSASEIRDDVVEAVRRADRLVAGRFRHLGIV